MSGLATAAAWAVLAPGASAVVVHTAAGRFFGVMPRAGVALSRGAGAAYATPNVGAATSTGALEYHGGPVLHTTRPYLIFWDPAGTAIDATTRALLTRYMTDTSADSALNDDVFDVTRQYTDATGYAASGETFSAGQALSDRQPYPASGNCTRKPAPITTCLTDAQIAAELQRITAAENLPTGMGTDTPVYVVILPATVNVCITGTECADNYFCAYHGDFPDSDPSLIYAAIPLLNAIKECQLDSHPSVLQEPNGTAADVAVDNLSHEYNEAISDPEGNAWYDDGSDNEEGDFCQKYAATRDPVAGTDPNAYGLAGASSAALLGALSDQSINGHPYYTQSEWSNGAADCELHTEPFVMAGFTTSPFAEEGAATMFDPMAGTGTDSSNTWNFGDGTSTFAIGAPARQSHAYAAPGPYRVSRTEVDSLGSLGTQSQTVVVDLAPRAAFTASAAVAGVGSNITFDAGASSDANPGVHITRYDWSFGDGQDAHGSPSAGHRYVKAGTYTVSLMVFASDGLIGAATVRVRVENVPRAEPRIESAYAAARSAVRFGETVTPGTSPIAGRRWSFGDGTSGTGASPRHTYRHAGRYVVGLAVVTATGLRSTRSRVFTVHPAEAITKMTLRPAPGHRVRLTVSVSGPGTLVIAGHHYRLSRAGSISCLLTLAPRVGVAFRPLAGRRIVRTERLTRAG